MNFVCTRKIILFIVIFLIFLSSPVFASTTDGTVDSTDKYAWGENIGWLNFGTIEGDVYITDSALTGYIWSENVGWISLNCSNDSSCSTVDYKVANNNEGALSGYAWSENTGWIDFNPTGGGVTIDSSGDFSGYAWGENIGWIVFNCSTTSSCGTVDYKINTDWRPASSRTTIQTTTSSSGGGSGAPPPNPVLPEQGFQFSITPAIATTTNIILHFNAGSDITKIAIANNSDFSPAKYINYATSTRWVLSGESGEEMLYVKFCNKYGRCSESISAKVIYTPPEIEEEPIVKLPLPEVVPPTEKPKEPFIEKVPEILEPLVPGFLKPEPSKIAPEEIPIEELIPKEAPLTLSGKWGLLPQKAIERFVLAPLPEEIRLLAAKFPALESTFAEIGIATANDVGMLQAVNLTLPGLHDLENVPTDIVFAKTSNQLIDLNATLSVDAHGKTRQGISTISGKPIHLTVRPEGPVESIKGYFVFKSRHAQAKSQEYNGKLNNLLASALFSYQSAYAQPEESQAVSEELLVLFEFEYTDSDGDGIYTAEISAPVVEGEYEIITVMDYENPKLGMKEFRLTTVIDPEGYIYENIGGKEARIPNAAVSIFWLNPEAQEYVLWSASEYSQKNPQITNKTGRYSFLVPEGSYYIEVEASGYTAFIGDPFQVREDNGIHMNIELRSKRGLLKVINWKVGLLILIILLLLYNFYRDRIREKLLRKSV